MASSLGLGVALLGLSACSSHKAEPQPQVIIQQEQATIPVVTRKAPGTVEYVWEEPMVNVIDVPAGLDPEGHYYIPAHQAVIEIRQGRWNYQPE